MPYTPSENSALLAPAGKIYLQSVTIILPEIEREVKTLSKYVNIGYQCKKGDLSRSFCLKLFLDSLQLACF